MTGNSIGSATPPAGEIDATVVRGLLHELRTPLNVLVGYADLLDDGSLDAGAHQRVTRIQGAAGRLTGLLDLAADLARAVQGLTPTTTLPADEALAMAIDAISADAAARRIILEHDDRPAAEPPAGPVPLGVRTLTCALTHAVHRSPGGARISARSTGQQVVIETSVEIPDVVGTPAAGQAGQRFWWDATTMLGQAAGATIVVEHPGTPGWRATLTLPAAGATPLR